MQVFSIQWVAISICGSEALAIWGNLVASRGMLRDFSHEGCKLAATMQRD
jgi:hypothetical protein